MLLCGYLVAHGMACQFAVRRSRAVLPVRLLAFAALWAAVMPCSRSSSSQRRRAGHPRMRNLRLPCSASCAIGHAAARAGLGDRALWCSAGLRGRDIPGLTIPISSTPPAMPAACWRLLAYPFLIEPNLGLAAQSRVWRSGFLVLAIWSCLRHDCVVAGAVGTIGDQAAIGIGRQPTRSRRPGMGDVSRWLRCVPVARSGLRPVELADGRDDLFDDRPGADPSALDHPAGACTC